MNKHFTEHLENQLRNEKIVKQFKFLVERYKNEIEQLKENESFKDDKKVQTVSVLREVIQDIELILDMK